MNNPKPNVLPVDPTRAGPAFRVTLIGPQHAEAYANVYALIDPDHAVVHVLSADGQTHFLSIPIQHALIEWRDPAPLDPQPRIPPFGSGAFERLGEEIQRMTRGMGRAFGQE